jgi:tetratricopeptide (TPR) repeat protein
MSLVNEMLNDLEKRNQTAVGSLDFPGIPEEKHRPPYIKALLALLLVLGLAWLSWQYADRLAVLAGLGSKEANTPLATSTQLDSILAEHVVDRTPSSLAADSAAQSLAADVTEEGNTIAYQLPENELLGVQSFVEGDLWHVVITASLSLDYSFELEEAQAISLRFEDTILRQPLNSIRHPVWVEAFSFDQEGDDLLLHVAADRRFSYQKRFQEASDGGPAILQLWIKSQQESLAVAPPSRDDELSEVKTDNVKVEPSQAYRLEAIDTRLEAIDTRLEAEAIDTQDLAVNKRVDRQYDQELYPDQDPALDSSVDHKADGQMSKVAVALSADEEDHKVAVQAAKLVQRGEHRLAESQLRSTESRAFYIALLLRQNRQDEALIQIEAGLLASANQRVFVKLKSRWLLQQQDYVEAYKLIKSHAEQSGPKVISASQDLEFVELLASLAQQNGAHQDALGYYQQLAKFNPKRFGYWLGMAVALESLQSWRQALGAYNAALTTQTADASLLVFAKQRQVALSERLKN